MPAVASRALPYQASLAFVSDRPLERVVFALAGSLLVAARDDGSLQAWDAASGRARWTVDALRAPALGLAADPGGEKLVVWSASEIATLIASDGRSLTRRTVDAGTVAEVRWSSDTSLRALHRPHAGATPAGAWRVVDMERDVEAYVSPAGCSAAALSHDGAHVAEAIAGSPGRIDVVELATGERRTLGSHGRDTYVVFPDPTDEYPRSGSETRDVVVESLAFSPSGRWLASFGDNHKGRLWSVGTGGPSEAAAIDGRCGWFASDDTLCVASSGLRLVEVGSAGAGRTKVLELDPVCVAGHPSVEYLAIAARSRPRGVERLRPSGEEFTRATAGHQGRVTGLGFSPDASQLVSISEDGTLVRWDLARGEGSLLARVRDINHQRVLSTDAGGTLLIEVSASSTRTRLVTAEGRIQERHAPVPLADAAISGSGARAFYPISVLRRVEPGVLLVDLEKWVLGERCLTPVPHASHALSLSPDERLLAAAIWPGVAVYRLSADGRGELVQQIALPPELARGEPSFTPRRSAFSRDASLLALGGESKVVVFDLARGSAVLTLQGPRGLERGALGFSNDGRTLVAAGVVPRQVEPAASVAYAWSLPSGELQWSLREREHPFINVALAPGARCLAAGHEDGRVEIFDFCGS